MRAAPTPAEQALWRALRNGALGGRFRRQHPVGRFIADFCCLRARLVVEVDGSAHAGREPEDAERDAHLASAGYRVLRFPNARVMQDLTGVLGEIRTALQQPH